MLSKAVGRNELPFNRDTHVAASNTVLDGPIPTGGGYLGVGTCSNATYCQITLAFVSVPVLTNVVV